jgi:hypothetical protein
MEREYTWYLRDGVFIRSPLRASGVTIGEAERRRAEEEWFQRERRRQANRDAGEGRVPAAPDFAPAPENAEVIRQALEPGFVSHAYFLRFKFDPGQYALAGRERLAGRDVLRIEYYPTRLFEEGRTRPNREMRKRDDEIEEKMNKVSLVTLWVEPSINQILQYEFDNIDMDFLPGRWLVRLDDLHASMRMSEPFPDVWLPRSIQMRFGATMAVGRVEAQYDVEYYDHRLATVTTRVR